MKWRQEFLRLKEVPKFEDAVPRWDCSHPVTRPTRFVRRDGLAYVRHQCQQCGTQTKGLKTKELEKQGQPISDLPDWDEPLARRWMDRMHQHGQTHQPLQASFNLYQQYLQSDTWKSKRKRVLQRDAYLCQACCDAKAVEVHHKTYQHIGDEPLFELISVCKECHLQFHQNSPFFP